MFLVCLEKECDVRRIMLPIRIKSYGICESHGESFSKTLTQGTTLALVLWIRDKSDATHLVKGSCGTICAAIVHDDDIVTIVQCVSHYLPNALLIIIGRNNDTDAP